MNVIEIIVYAAITVFTIVGLYFGVIEKRAWQRTVASELRRKGIDEHTVTQELFESAELFVTFGTLADLRKALRRVDLDIA
jgi:hypothetical protein